ncbi:MAG: TetR/AcrR family transcriptional regulator [Verrucomicrobia bacterium]|nr:TetR/AcrR family transcriptional regulator [Verrucomicrobiota bacterium]MCG2679267.1 TetR/AcrR family transcriptional regulator [Kiritimatiellia bacterium]MBU4247757.1 TetR/AcrR family transcriptional regulator [Verrucomicrobiota bacterium]MBU4290964.1 TetR/AcrR family transcriptional regulator [Verrucomicrobiota bacterium]MBU4430299.1 TetR/AcrR family transcriptional regulator [Verrucomicrobiota bacterium]
MARQVSIRNETILEAARKVFLRYGFQAATARIAREAGISEGSIFKHFKTKSGLFLAAMQVETKLQAWQEQLMQSVGAGDIRKTLNLAGRTLLRQIQTIMPRIVMIRSSGITITGGGRFSDQPPPEIKILTAYFKAEAQQGRLITRAPEALAHIFVSAISHYVFCETIFGYRPLPPEAYVRVLIDTLLQAVLPAQPGRPGFRPRPGTGPQRGTRRARKDNA